MSACFKPHPSAKTSRGRVSVFPAIFVIAHCVARDRIKIGRQDVVIGQNNLLVVGNIGIAGSAVIDSFHFKGS